MKLTLKYSSFLFVNGVSLMKNVEQEVQADKLTNKDKIILNAYIKSGAVLSDGGEFAVDLEEIVEEVVAPAVVEETKVEVKEEAPAPSVADILDEPKEEVAEEPVAKKKTTAKKTTAKK